MTGKQVSFLALAISFVSASLIPATTDAQWVQTAGPGGGSVTCLLPRGSTVFAGTHDGGVYVSSNTGSSWTPARTGLTTRVVRALAFAGPTLFAGTDGGVFASTDSGASWRSLGTTFTAVTSLVYTGSALLAGVNYDGVYVSTDNGTTWNETLTAQRVTCLTMNGTNIFAGTDLNGPFRSTDNGSTWTPDSGGLPFDGKIVYCLCVHKGNLFAGTAAGPFISTNNGATWTAAGNGLPSGPVITLAGNSTTLFAGASSQGVYLSTNNGSNWSPASSGLRDLNVQTLAWNSTVLMAGTANAGVYMSTDGAATWIYASSGILNASVTSLARVGSTMIAGTVGAGAFVSSNDGASWLPPGTGMSDPNVFSFMVGGQFLFAGTGSGVFRSTDGGLQWTPANGGMTGSVHPLAQSAGGLFAGVMGGSSPGVWRSTDNGTTWTVVNNGLPSQTQGRVWSLLFRGPKLLLGGEGGVFASTDNGADWTTINGGLAGTTIYALDDSGGTIYAGGMGMVFRSTNEGAIWTDMSSGIPAEPVTGFAVVGKYVFAAISGGGIYYSTGWGTSWHPLNVGFDDLLINTVVVGGTNLFAGSSSSAVWRRPVYEMIPPENPVAVAASNIGASGFTANWNAAAGTIAYRLDVSADSAFASFVATYGDRDVGNVLSSPVTGVSPSTTFYYRVRGTNTVGSGDNSNTIRVQTLVSPPGPPTPRGPGNVTQTGFTANWSPVAGAATYRLDVATDPAFTAFVAGYKDLDVGTDTARGVSGLTPATDYYFRVRGVNGSGPGPNSGTTMVTTLANAPAAPTATAPTNVTSSGFTANWTSTSGAVSYDLDIAFDSAFTSFVSGFNDLNAGFTTSHAVSGVPEATVFYYRVRARSTGGPGPNSNVMSATTFRSYPPSYIVSATVTFATSNTALNEYQSSDYRLIGIPGNDGRPISAFLGGAQGTTWEIYRDNGRVGKALSPSDYYVRFAGGDSGFSASPGKAFWLLNLGNWVLNSRMVATAPLDSAGNVTIKLTPGVGFNLITNPYLYPIPWSRIASANGITDTISSWASGWISASSFEPFKGYLFFNSTGKASLNIPLQATLPKAGIGRLPDPGSWRVDVIARCGRFADQSTSFGVSPDALSGLDGYEQRKPRHFAEVPDVYFRRQAWDPKYPEFATDIRDRVGELGIWDLSVRSDEKKEVNIEFRGIERVPRELAVMLIDESAAVAQDLRANTMYSLHPLSPEITLKVAVGSPGRVRDLAARAAPSRYALLQNYPNPFNPRTTIPVEIPGQSSILLEIYDVLGRHIATLYEGGIPSGRHFFDWNGVNGGGIPVSSGVYLARLSVRSGPTFVTRISLVK